MGKFVSILVVSAKGDLLMRRVDGDSEVNSEKIVAFGGAREAGDVPIQSAVRVLREETGLDVESGDLEYLDTYDGVGAGDENQVFILAGVNEERVHAYGGEESLRKIHRSDDFDAVGVAATAHKYVIDYFKRHKKR